jgi:hypothetical protein
MLVGMLMAGCADMDVPQPKNILKDPLGEGSLKTGMSKDKVRDIYGDPDIIDMVISPDWNEYREQWVYTATTSLPVGTGFLSEDLYLYFDGDNLTNISRKPLGKIQSNESIK